MVASAGGHGSLIGARLGEYEVEALIGRGAMGAVYLARDTKLNRLVALKVLLGSLARTPAVVKQFHKEAQAAAPLKHPGIVRIYSAGTEAGTPYIAMEFVDGEPLDRFLQRKGKVSWKVALHIGAKLAQALDAAHRGGVVHRDIKPSNIMLDRKGGVRLTDFGIASIQSDESAPGGDSKVVGTPQYMSPEQVTGGEVGPSTDLFALGVTLYRMISGEMPFRGESSMAMINSICEDDPPRLNKLDPSIPDDVARLVAYLIEKTPSARPANAKVVYGLIHRLLKQRGGASVVSESLTAFLKEETEARPFRRLGSVGSGTTKSESGATKRGFSGHTSISWRRTAQAAVITVLAAAALAIGPTASKFTREKSADRAPAMALASFGALSPGVTRLLVFADGYELGRVSWVGKKPVALLEVRGVRGSLTQDLSGLLAVDPIAEEVLSLHAPAPATKARTPFATRTAGSFTIEIPPMPEDAPLLDSFLVHARGSTARPIITLAQRWDSATPELEVLFRATEKEWLGPSASQWDPGPIAQVALSPDGHTLCMLLYDEEARDGYLVERDVRAKPLHYVGDRRTTVADIVPTSLQYSPNGSRIAYLRRTYGDELELWLLAANGAERNGHRLATGITSEIFAFSPDGKHIAVVMRDGRFGQPQVSLLDARLGEIDARFGPGRLSREAWHPTGRYFAFVAEDEASALKSQQLYAAFAEPPYPKSQITFIDKGLDGDYALSRDGEWAAAVGGDVQVPTLFFFELAKLDARTRTPGDAL
ncbi:MAG: serine/threonine-protein kinase [Candidatus Hydrogenedentes bacterium]|nr:serine/threonine-protein kinase [Candidatus Hydrogenedentota bacterium]